MSPEPEVKASAPLLLVDGLVKQFDGFRALDGVSFQIRPGEILGLVGPNGSGKTTCINVISGLYAPDGGSVRFRGKSIGGWASHRLVHIGINRTFQVPKPFHSLSVQENIQIAATYGQRGTTRADIDYVLELLDLTGHAARKAEELNSVHLKMLDLARALATKPVLLCLDELAAGFNPGELTHVVEQVHSIARSGVAIIVVEHLMGFIEDVTDRVIVLNAGKGIFEGVLADAVQDRQVIDVFLGSQHEV
ncbi:ABC transporter ATP-binding protein [Alcaligenaceae bacterium]|nr:ABC transporter ATP-binding protein [Alcaligenaceae bacterium]